MIIEAPKGKQVDLTFSTFFTKSDICISQETGITVHDGDTAKAEVMSRLCSTDKFADRKFLSSSGYLHIQFATGNIPMAFKAVFDFSKTAVFVADPLFIFFFVSHCSCVLIYLKLTVFYIGFLNKN